MRAFCGTNVFAALGSDVPDYVCTIQDTWVHFNTARVQAYTGRHEDRMTRLNHLSALQGVASGDPFPKSVILWTRVTPKGGLNKPAFLDYAVATDKCESFCNTPARL
jgi:phosphodiesterase/alkaline phosphatase D-like protein